jgi:hypothetical protein
MAFEDLRAEIADLFGQMTEKPEDAHELAAQIHELLNELRATGMPLPDDLVALAAELEAGDFAQSPDPETVRPSPLAEEEDDPLLESPGPPPE